MKIKIILAMIVIIITSLITGCASYTAQNVDRAPVTAFANKVDADGITFAADFMTDSNKITKIFSADTNSKGYLPVEIVVENNSPDTLLVESENISITDTKGTIKTPVKSDTVATEFEHNKMAEAFWGFGMMSYQAADDANKKMHQDWADKSFPSSKLLTPTSDAGAGHSVARGIIFFKATPKDISGSTLAVSVMNTKTNTTVKLQILLK